MAQQGPCIGSMSQRISDHRSCEVQAAQRWQAFSRQGQQSHLGDEIDRLPRPSAFTLDRKSVQQNGLLGSLYSYWVIIVRTFGLQDIHDVPK